MRILHVDSGRSWRGGQAQVLHLMRGLASRGDESHLAAPPGSPLGERARAAGFDVTPIELRGDLDVVSAVGLAGVMRRIRPDLVHAHTARAHALGVFAADLAGVRHRVVTRRVDLPLSGGLFGQWKYRRGVSRYIAISEAVRERLLTAGIEPGRIRVVYSGIPAETIAPAGDPAARAAARTALSLPLDRPVIGLVGALTREKGHDLAIRALVAVPEARLVLVGEGPEREAIRQLAASLGVTDRVVFAGFRDDLDQLWPAFDMVVAPSRHEGLGTSVIEAMASGQAIVASRVGEMSRLLDEGRAGVLVTPDTVDALGAAMAELIRDPARRTALGRAARERAARYSIAGMVSGTATVYDELAGIDRRENAC